MQYTLANLPFLAHLALTVLMLTAARLGMLNESGLPSRVSDGGCQ